VLELGPFVNDHGFPVGWPNMGDDFVYLDDSLPAGPHMTAIGYIYRL
jgi:hypothetical protein